jgi:hypothetical protein
VVVRVVTSREKNELTMLRAGSDQNFIYFLLDF